MMQEGHYLKFIFGKKRDLEIIFFVENLEYGNMLEPAEIFFIRQ